MPHGVSGFPSYRLSSLPLPFPFGGECMFQRLLRSRFLAGGGFVTSAPDGKRSFGLRPFVPLVVVFAALASLTLIGAVLERAVSGVRREVTQLTEPGRSIVQEIQILLAMESAGFRGYLLTQDTAFLASHRTARAGRKAAVRDLSRLVRESDPGLRDLAARLASQLEPTDALLDSVNGGTLSRAQFLQRLPVQQQRLETITATTRLLGERLSRIAADRVASAQRTHRMALVAGAPIMALAVIAVILVGELSVGYRALAAREHEARAAADAARVQADERRMEVERMSESRSRLLRGFTHDVKNPLGAALGMLTLVDEGLITPQDGVARAKRSVSSGIRLIEDLLRLERGESGDMMVTRAPLDLCAVALESADEWRPSAEAKGLRMTVNLPDELPALVSDAGKIRQVLGNLVSNAIKYTHAGSVTIRVAARDAAGPSNGRRWAVVEVRDTGPGIAAEQQELLFQEYRRLSTSAGTSGHGLGLAISQRIAAALGGHIAVESAVGIGSAFILFLPGETDAAAPSLPSLPATFDEATAAAPEMSVI